MFKKNLLIVFSLCILSPLISMDEPSSKVSCDNIYRSCSISQQYKQINRNAAGLEKSFNENTLWHIGELRNSNDLFYIDVKNTVRIQSGTPYTTPYTGILSLLVPVTINLSQAQKIAWHAKHGKSIAALDSKGILYRLNIDHTSIGIQQKKFRFFKETEQAKPHFLEVSFNINENNTNYLTYQKKRNLCFKTIKKRFEKEEIVIDQSSIKVLKDCQQNKESCFLGIENQSTGKITIFQITQINGNADFFTDKQATELDPELINTNILLETPSPKTTNSLVLNANLGCNENTPEDQPNEIPENPEAVTQQAVQEATQSEEIVQKPVVPNVVAKESITSNVVEEDKDLLEQPESATPEDIPPITQKPIIPNEVVEKNDHHNTSNTKNPPSIIPEKKPFNFLNKYICLFATLSVLSLSLCTWHFDAIQLYFSQLIHHYGKDFFVPLCPKDMVTETEHFVSPVEIVKM